MGGFIIQKRIVMVFFAIVFAFILCGAASAANVKTSNTDVKIKYVGTSSYDQWEPNVDGTRVVWTQTDSSGHFAMYYKNLAVGKTIKVRQTSDYIAFIGISGTRVVWVEDTGPNISVYYKNLATGYISKVHPSNNAQYFSAISGTRVVWEENSALYFKNMATGSFGKIFASKDSQSSPNIKGSRIVWEQWDTNQNTYIYMKNLATGKVAKIAKVGIISQPKIIGKNKILWTLHRKNGGTGSYPTYDTTVFLKNMSTGKTIKLFRSSLYNTDFGISANRLVWKQQIKIGGIGEETVYKETVYIKNLATGSVGRIFPSTKNQTYPVISGNLVVWIQEMPSGHHRIYYKNLVTKKVASLTH